ncbi:hypothetical protein DES36_102157 [Alkalibaculum bacchi]|jgi:hypothetical protein|uniref:Uncharacterized protein n=1 Tax=Alkalibaculum bacchi TaxID=645887 RepID=A0A366IDE5_9FIRM|nr:hypothetical protein [Alkalibaculum bacchi]RBP69014.1 hypothetical protein DES36_102157 [Alkalibaculum bacchi]
MTLQIVVVCLFIVGWAVHAVLGYKEDSQTRKSESYTNKGDH